MEYINTNIQESSTPSILNWIKAVCKYFQTKQVGWKIELVVIGLRRYVIAFFKTRSRNGDDDRKDESHVCLDIIENGDENQSKRFVK